MKKLGPDSRYIMLYMGAWRPVMNILDANNIQRTDARHVCKVVLWLGPHEWEASLAGPADLIERPSRDPNEREWEMVD